MDRQWSGIDIWIETSLKRSLSCYIITIMDGLFIAGELSWTIWYSVGMLIGLESIIFSNYNKHFIYLSYNMFLIYVKT